MKNKNYLFYLILFTSIVIGSCNSDDEETSTLISSDQDDFNELDYKITSIIVTDVSNKGDASDLNVVFNEPTQTDIVIGYRILIFPNSETNVDLFNDDNNYQLIDEIGAPSDQQNITLNGTLKTFDGNVISEGVTYEAAIVSVLSNDSLIYVLSDFSNEFQLVQEANVSTLVKPITANDALTIDPDGNLYASNYNGNQIMKISQSGDVSVYTSGLTSPLALLYKNNNSIIAIDGNTGGSGSINEVNSAGTVTEIAQIEGWPSGLTIDADDNILVANYLKPNIYKITPAGEVSIAISDSRLKGCVGIHYDLDNDIIYTSNYDNGKVFKIDNSGAVTELADINLPSGTSSNLGVTGYLTMHEGVIYVSGLGGNRVYSITLDGEVATVAGSTKGHADGTASLSKFDAPNGIVGFENKLFVLDYGQPAIRVIELN